MLKLRDYNTRSCKQVSGAFSDSFAESVRVLCYVPGNLIS